MNNNYNNFNNYNNYNNYSDYNSYNNTNNIYNNLNNKHTQNNKVIVMTVVIILVIVSLLSFNYLKRETKNEESLNENNEVESLTNVKKEKMIQTIDSYITATINSLNNYDFGPLSDSSVLYYIPVSDIEEDSCVYLEKGGESSLGAWEKAYVAVSYDPYSYSYEYYFTFITTDGYQMPLTKSTDIRNDGSQITKDNRLNVNNITSQLNERATTTKTLITPKEVPGYLENVKSCHSSNTNNSHTTSNSN